MCILLQFSNVNDWCVLPARLRFLELIFSVFYNPVNVFYIIFFFFPSTDILTMFPTNHIEIAVWTEYYSNRILVKNVTQPEITVYSPRSFNKNARNSSRGANWNFFFSIIIDRMQMVFGRVFPNKNKYFFFFYSSSNILVIFFFFLQAANFVTAVARRRGSLTLFSTDIVACFNAHGFLLLFFFSIQISRIRYCPGIDGEKIRFEGRAETRFVSKVFHTQRAKSVQKIISATVDLFV